jgi:hypothetical protein
MTRFRRRLLELEQQRRDAAINRWLLIGFFILAIAEVTTNILRG